ncbi:hypothetical protein D3C81_1808860 [compost metagenome]
MACEYIFQLPTAYMIPIVAITGLDSGSTMLQIIRVSPQPSIRAESSSSPGRFTKKERITNRLYALIAPGIISTHRVFSIWRFFSSR